MKEPQAPQHPVVLRRHGDERIDEYYWLRERDNPAVLQYLEEENAYFREQMAPLASLVDSLYQDLVHRIPAADQEVPVRRGPYFYYRKMMPGQQYPIWCRRRAERREALPTAPEEVLLDVNQLAEGHPYFAVMGVRMSPDHTRLVYLENRDGTDRCTLKGKTLTTGEPLPLHLENVYLTSSVEWDASGHYLFYLTVDATQRPFQLWRHSVGMETADTLIYEETDPTFSLRLRKSQDGHYLFLASENKTHDEIRYLSAQDPLGDWQIFIPRSEHVQYVLEHWQGQWVWLTNHEAPNFRLMRGDGPDHADPLVPYEPSKTFERLFPFADALVIQGREEGLTQVWIYREGEFRRLAWHEDLYTVKVVIGQDYDAQSVLIEYESFLTPRKVYNVPLSGGPPVMIHEAPWPTGYDPTFYRQERQWVTAADGTRIPVSLVYRADRLVRPAPLWLYGYGSYGISIDPAFEPSRLVLLDRGILFAVAHVRGGGEMGRSWYEHGKFLEKAHTFDDFIAVAKAFIERGDTTPDRLAAQGRSAGGLLMGAVANRAPELFRVISAGVPFVDVVTTMLDPSIPLTTLEWDEWGDPRQPEYYFYMKSYSPYDNVTAQAYPHLFVYAGLNDPRVGYWEPAKWVSRLRRLKTDDHVVVLRTHMGAGHGGSSGRYDHLRETAEEYAFMLHHLGVDET